MSSQRPRQGQAGAPRGHSAPAGGLDRAFDVTDQAAVDAGCRRVEAEVGPIDILINNAGMQKPRALSPSFRRPTGIRWSRPTCIGRSPSRRP